MTLPRISYPDGNGLYWHPFDWDAKPITANEHKLFTDIMRKQYRIRTIESDRYRAPLYIVQVKGRFGRWHEIKVFYDPWDKDFARREAEELLDKLNES